GFALSDDFSADRFGVQWSFHDPAPDERQRVRYESKGLRIAAKGRSPVDSPPLTCIVGDRAYVAEATLELDDGAEGGLLLFYNHKAFVGVGFTPTEMRTYQFAEEQPWMRQSLPTRNVRIRLTNDRHIVTCHYSHDAGKTWVQHGHRMEVSGIHHNVFGGFLSLKVGIYAANRGSVLLRRFSYRALV
ncbi:MAG TPA: xylan 1,4-beta-xylosidase, partial [Xanthomonadaceae bacterium]|nr:xylan 1,4-beta-xylosidase [Xanthomonadaceae bacterium]